MLGWPIGASWLDLTSRSDRHMIRSKDSEKKVSFVHKLTAAVYIISYKDR
jgi:hypothetical protein